MTIFVFGAFLAVIVLQAGAGDLNDYETNANIMPSITPRILSYTVYRTVAVGQTVTFPCEAIIPDDVSVVWKKKEKNYNFVADIDTLHDDRFRIVNRTTLQISTVVPTDSGHYTCEIDTKPRLALSHTLKVTSRRSQSDRCSGKFSKWIDSGGDYCYFIEQDINVTWIEAVYQCFLKGGSLATFQSMQELQRTRRRSKQSEGKVYIGLWKHKNGTFEWVDKSPSAFRNWAEGEPSDVTDTCVEIDFDNGKWNNVPCDKNQGYMCSGLKSHASSVSRKACSNSSPEWTDLGTEYCYIIELYNQTTSEGAVERCSAAGGSPASFHSVEEISVVTNQIVHQNDSFHIGLRQNSHGIFEWMDHRPMDLNFWEDGELDDIGRCAEMLPGSGHWNAIPCNKSEGYICSSPKVSQCVEMIIAEEGVIQSPGYPDNYGSNEVCTWKITVPEYYGVLLNFKAFEVEGSPGCASDYVEILDGHYTTSTVLGRYCGYRVPRETLSSGRKMTVRFVSDRSQENFGFLAEFKKADLGEVVLPTQSPVTEDADCEGAIDYEKGTLVSPHYPDYYTSSKECNWTIRAPPGSRISLRFKTFEVENCLNCMCDYVSVRDGPDVPYSTLSGRLCGRKVPDFITSSGNQMIVHFKSDSSGLHKGFAATFNTSDSSSTGSDKHGKETCEENITSNEGVIQSPNYPENYGPNEKCTWKITVPSNHQVVLQFIHFKVEEHDGCAYDYVLVRDGHSSGSRVLKELCGYEIPSEIRSSGNKLMVEFRSDSSMQYRGFSVKFSEGQRFIPSGITPQMLAEEDCGGDIYADNGTIHSPNYPLSYGPLQECIWKITVPEGYVVSFKFGPVNLEQSPSCNFDHVAVLDGQNSDSPVVKTVCQSTDALPIYFSTNKITVKFTSDESFEGSGFSAAFRKAISCGENIMADKGVLESPNIAYGSGYKCTWRITVPDNYTVLLKTQKDQENNIDYSGFFFVRILNGPDIFSPTLKEYYSNVHYTLRSTGNEMFVMVTSDERERQPQFYAEFEADICGGDFISDSGIITSPNFPDNYLPFENCTWKITVPNNYQVRLSFKSFSIENSSNCNYDYLDIFDGHDPLNSALLGKFCGQSNPATLQSTTNKMSLRFVSDSSKEKEGFTAEFSGVAVGNP